MSMVAKEGRSPIALVRQGTEPCMLPHDFEKECNFIQGNVESDVMHESFVDIGQDVGLGGCPKSTPADNDMSTCSALAWYDMIELDDEKASKA